MVRTRTIREAAAYFQEADPHTCLRETAIRTLLRAGDVPCARVGRKYLVHHRGPGSLSGGLCGAGEACQGPAQEVADQVSGHVLSAKGNKIIPCRHLVFAL